MYSVSSNQRGQSAGLQLICDPLGGAPAPQGPGLIASLLGIPFPRFSHYIGSMNTLSKTAWRITLLGEGLARALPSLLAEVCVLGVVLAATAAQPSASAILDLPRQTHRGCDCAPATPPEQSLPYGQGPSRAQLTYNTTAPSSSSASVFSPTPGFGRPA